MKARPGACARALRADQLRFFWLPDGLLEHQLKRRRFDGGDRCGAKGSVGHSVYVIVDEDASGKRRSVEADLIEAAAESAQLSQACFH